MITKQKFATLIVTFGLLSGIMSIMYGSIVLAAPTTVGPCQDTETSCEPDTSTQDNGGSTTDQPPPEQQEDIKCDTDTCCGKVNTSIIGKEICGNETDNSSAENSTVWLLLMAALQILTAGIGIAAVGGIVYGALLYSTAEDKPDQTKKAISIITNVVIGLVLYGLMYVLLNFLIPGGIFK